MGAKARMRRRGTGRMPAVMAVMVGAALTGALVPSAAHAQDDGRLVLHPMICSKDGVCLAYTVALADEDGDGVPDVDEKAVGTKLADAASTPSVGTLTAVLGKGWLPSFELGYSEVIVLPTTLPDGTPLVRDVTSAVKAQSSALARMGVADELLKTYGLDVGTGVVLDQAAGAVGMHLDKDGRPVRDGKTAPVQKRVGGIVMGWIADGADGGVGGEKGDGAPVDLSGTGGFGTDKNGGADFWTKVKEGVKDMFGGDKKPDTPDAGKPVSMSTGDEGDLVIPITAADMEKVVVKLGATTKPVSGDPKVGPDITGVDLNPRRTIILTDDPVGKRLLADILKILVVTPDPDDPSVRDTNFGPNGGIVPGVAPDSGWPKD